ncbi:hypothetical protein B0H19DRAFT_1376305 [Mycena capillaripes]|nr:hypothetical protein B0H19DRAFT_1376305 [Mycena capillaripes]
MIIEDLASDILAETGAITSSSQLFPIALAIKTEEDAGPPIRLKTIQLRTKDKIYVFDVAALTSPSHLLPSLRAILTNPSIIKVGHSIRQTLHTISEVFSVPELGNILKDKTPPIIDLEKYTKLKGAIDQPSASLQALAGIVLGRAFPLPTCPMYAPASSAYNQSLCDEIDCQWQIFISLLQRNSIGLPLQQKQAETDGQLVTLVQGCKPIAEGCIIGQHPGYLDAIMDDNGHTTRINVSSSRSLIQISKVLLPGAIHSLHHQTMEWIFAHGKQAVVATSQLHTRGEIPPTPTCSLSRGFAAPAPPPPPEGEDEFCITYSAAQPSTFPFKHWSVDDLEGEQEDSDDSDSDNDCGPEEDEHGQPAFQVQGDYSAISQDPNMMQGIEDEFEGRNTTDAPLETIMEGIEHTRTLLNNAVESKKLPSRVLDDAFHFMDRLLRLLPKKHSAFKAFSHDFSEAIFIRDKSDVLAVQATLKKHGIDWEYAKRAQAPALNRRIRRFIPDRKTLLRRLDLLFDAYADIQCSTKKTRGSFFSDEAKEMAKHLRETVRKGYLSDPSGISLYYLMGKDREGLKIYRTVRGTNSVEGGVHMAIRRIFGSLQAFPELAECLILNWILRRNKRVGFHNRTGQKYRGHYDIWIGDEIVELAVATGSKPSFPRPRILSTRIATFETIGILPISTSLAEDLKITTLPRPRISSVPHHRDLPVHTLTRLSTKPTNLYRYLQLRQRVLYAVLPVHTHMEYSTFKAHINDPHFRKGSRTYPPHEQWKNIDFHKFAQFWNVLVHGQSRTVTESTQRLYYKLPLHLETHHKKTILWKSELSTFASGTNFTFRAPLIAMLNSSDNFADALPAVPLPDGELDLSISVLGSVDPKSFDPMATIPAPGMRSDSEFVEGEEGTPEPTFHNLFHHANPDGMDQEDDEMEVDPPEVALRQTLLPGAGPAAPVKTSNADRCAGSATGPFSTVSMPPRVLSNAVRSSHTCAAASSTSRRIFMSTSLPEGA